MPQKSKSASKTLIIINELVYMFADDFPHKEKIKMLIENVKNIKRLFEKLLSVAEKYDKKGETIDGQNHFLNQLIKFKELMEENLKKSTQTQSIVLIIDDYISAIRDDYKLIRDYVQTLEDINVKIEKKSREKKDKSKIGQLIIRGVEEKMPHSIYFAEKHEPEDHNRKMEIVKKFYGFFVNYISYVRESLGNGLDDNKYRLKLEDLQTKLMKTEPLDIKYYFSLMIKKITSDRGYSTEVLLEHLSENPMVHRSVTNDSDYYFDMFIELSKVLKGQQIKFQDKKCIEPLNSLAFKLDEENFKKLHCLIFQDDVLIDMVFKTIYDKGINLYLNELDTIAKAGIGQKIVNYFRPTATKHLDQLKRNFSNIFTIISSENIHLFNKLQDSIIDEKNSTGTFILLKDLYGQRIQNLDISDEIINVKYCFNYYFFKSLDYQDLDDVSGLPTFCRLLFYINVCDNTKESIENLSKNDYEVQYKIKIMDIKSVFLRVYSEDTHKTLNDLVEILKIMMNIQAFDFRYKCTKSILSELENEQECCQKINVKVKFLKMFFNNSDNHREICLRLAQSFNLHLLKDVLENQNHILVMLCDSNWNFNLFIEKLKDLGKEFDIGNELISGLSTPYCLSVKLLEDERCNKNNPSYNEANNKIAMSILFRVFTCSSERDKEEFFKNRSYLYKEFLNLFESINRLIKFYKDDKPNNVFEELQKISIENIIDGFSAVNEESLKERYDNARVIIDNFMNYRSEYIDHIVNSTSKDEIFKTFDIVLKRSNRITLQEWAEQTSKLGDKVYFLYCYHKYSEKEFDKWFNDLNPNTSSVIYQAVKAKRDLVKQEIEKNKKAYELINIRYLQHNQVGALALIYDYLEDPVKSKNNLFIKIGTGQGKSLTIAETARKVIEINRINHRPAQKIFVITCYDHLARRDYENYINYYKYFDIKSMHCSRTSSTKDFEDKDVIYADLETYFYVLREEGYKTLTEFTSIDLPDTRNAVLIMDEFDSLILDSDEILQRVYNFNINFHSDIQIIQRPEDIRNLFNMNVVKHLEVEFQDVFYNWCHQILNAKREYTSSSDKSFQDGLGKVTVLAQPFLINLEKTSKASFIHFYLDCLTFYSKFKQVIGFSGSITENGRGGMNKFKILFENKRSIYYEIPPFFGLSNLKKNRDFANHPGKIIENRYDFLKAIRDDIRDRYLEQPILIFADSTRRQNEEKSGYEYIYENLMESKTKFLKDFTIIQIKSEADINANIHKIGKLGTITLATRIIGRGADIRVDKSIKKGLHLILTYIPKRENIYIQMLGRTARQDEKGSYSEIVQFKEPFVDIDEVKVDAKTKKIHEAHEYFYSKVSSSPRLRKIGVSWPLFSTLIQRLRRNEIEKFNINKFIDENFF